MIQRASQQYGETQVQTASSVQIVVLLYDCVIQSMKLAQEGIVANNLHDKARFLDRALKIVGELSAVLDMDQGGKIAVDLRRLYEYVQFELLEANKWHDSQRINGPIHCLSTVGEAWQELARRKDAPQAVGV